MATATIKKVAKALASLDALVGQTPVERVDIADIRSDLQSALEKLEALRTYQEAADTDYAELWVHKQRELQEFQQSRDAWIRTEIFSHIFKSMAH